MLNGGQDLAFSAEKFHACADARHVLLHQDRTVGEHRSSVAFELNGVARAVYLLASERIGEAGRSLRFEKYGKSEFAGGIAQGSHARRLNLASDRYAKFAGQHMRSCFGDSRQSDRIGNLRPRNAH